MILKAKALSFLIAVLVAVGAMQTFPTMVRAQTSGDVSAVAVGSQYDTTHVYVAADDFDRFVSSLVATFGGGTSAQGVFTVTPTPSRTKSQLVLTPVGTFSVFGFETPVPYRFGAERTGYLVGDFEGGLRAAEAAGADVVVAGFDDPIGKDAIIQWPGGVYMQLYWHTTAPHYPALVTVPENRVYVSALRADTFIRDFLGFSRGAVESDVANAPGAEIGRPGETYRRIRLTSSFGAMTVFVTKGFLPYPYGREVSGYTVADLAGTLTKAKAAGARVLVEPYAIDVGTAAMVQFPGGYIAEIQSRHDEFATASRTPATDISHPIRSPSRA